MFLFIYSRSEVRNFFENLLPGKSLFPKESSVLFMLMVRAYRYGVTHFPLIPEKIRLLLDIYLWQKILVPREGIVLSLYLLSPFYLYHFIEYMFYYTLSHIFWNYSEDIKKLYLK